MRAQRRRGLSSPARPAWGDGRRRTPGQNGARAAPAGLHTCGGGRRRSLRINRGCSWPRPMDATQGRARRWGATRNRRRSSSDGGAPGTVRPTRRDVTFSNKPTPSVIQRKGRRGRRPLRVSAKRRYQHRGKQTRKGNSLLPPLGSPERGAVAARSGVTEGLVQRWWGETTLSANPRRAGVEARPYGGWEGVSVYPTPSVIQRKGRRDGAPCGVCET